ncbi:MAG: NAD(P)/FAD-dependent oxidoreductase [Pseudomonadota bacterium]
MHRVQVVVSGAGPAGVVAACRLAKAGIDVLLVEAHADCPEDLRASTFHPPTLDMMEELGLLDALEAQGLKAPVYHYRNRRSGEVLAFDLSELADVARHPYRLQCEQYKLARLGVRTLEADPHGEVRFQRRLAHFEQDADGVTVHLETPVGIETVRADFLIAAEGANSLTRKWLDVRFEGFTYPEKFLTLSTTWPLEQHFDNLAGVNYVADPDEWCVLLRVPSVWRVLVPAPETLSDEELVSDAKKNAVFDGLMGDGASIVTEHRTIYRVHQRVAHRYDHGRVALIGDAAHLNNPLGGFGMNSGVHDAWNLTGKLIEVFDGAAHEPLLAHYDRQRRTVMNEFVQAQTIRNKQAMESHDSQQRHQADLQAILEDDARRRDYLLGQAMVKSREREAAIV